MQTFLVKIVINVSIGKIAYTSIESIFKITHTSIESIFEITHISIESIFKVVRTSTESAFATSMRMVFIDVWTCLNMHFVCLKGAQAPIANREHLKTCLITNAIQWRAFSYTLCF